MPGSTNSSFGEADDYRKAVSQVGGFDFVVTGRGGFSASLARISLDRMTLLGGEETLSRIAWITVPSSLVRVSLPMQSGQQAVWDGIASRFGELVTHGPGQRLHERTDGPCRWRTVWLQSRDLNRYGTAMMGASFEAPIATCRWRPARAALRRLTSLYDDAARATRVKPSLANSAGAARGLEQLMIEAMLDCLLSRSTVREPSAGLRGAGTMGRFEDCLRAHPNVVLSAAEVAGMLGVSDRSLRAYCQTYFGMGPTRYMRLRRMHAARRALRDLDDGAASVAEVAKRHGFSGPGRFSAYYRVQFGELPSATLRHASSR